MNILLGSLVLLGCASGQADATLHPYFAGFSEITLPNAEALVCVDGYVIPERFSYTGSPAEEGLWGRPAFQLRDPITFVLVRPGEVVVDGVTFTVPRPFYIATIELSTYHAAAFHPMYGPTDDDYENFVKDLVETHLSRYLPETEDAWVAHYASGKKPALHIDFTEASLAASVLANRSHTIVRLPTIGEWFSAMRAGQPTRYWWGDEWDARQAGAETRSTAADLPELLSIIEEVDRGIENPLGLRHTIGNVSEIIIPTPAERRILRRHFGPTSTEPARPLHHESGKFMVLPYSTMEAGGSVAQWPSLQGRTGLTLESLVSGQMISKSNDFVSARLVIEIPDGEISVDCAGQRDSSD